jgi:hypothetical protein
LAGGHTRNVGDGDEKRDGSCAFVFWFDIIANPGQEEGVVAVD